MTLRAGEAMTKVTALGSDTGQSTATADRHDTTLMLARQGKRGGSLSNSTGFVHVQSNTTT